MEQDELLKRLKEEFELVRKELKFKATFDELNNTFFLQDTVLQQGFTSPRLSRQICGRIADLFWSWNNFLHSLIMPNPSSMIIMTESQEFGEQEKKEIIRLMTRVMAHVSANSIAGLTKDKKLEAKFIDDSVALWNELSPKLTELSKKLNTMWTERAQVKNA